MVIPQRWHQSERHSILGEKMKIYPQVLTFFIKPKTWLFHVVVSLTTATKWTKVKNARAGRAKLLFLLTKYANSWRSRCRRRCRCLSSLLLSSLLFGSVTTSFPGSLFSGSLVVAEAEKRESGKEVALTFSPESSSRARRMSYRCKNCTIQFNSMFFATNILVLSFLESTQRQRNTTFVLIDNNTPARKTTYGCRHGRDRWIEHT